MSGEKTEGIEVKKVVCLILVCLGICFSGCSSTYDSYIEEVKNGYLGGFLDVTIDEVFSKILDGNWDGGETDDGKIIVQYQSNSNNMRIQFTVYDGNTFKVSAIASDGLNSETAEDAANIIKNLYMRYYLIEYPDKQSNEMMPEEAITNLLSGMSCTYAEKAKNPVNIANYLDKSEEDIKTALELDTAVDGILTSSEISIMYDSENSKVDNVILYNSRCYSLFGVMTLHSIDGANTQLSDKFAFVAERANADGTVSSSYIRNNSEDSLVIKYDSNTRYILEIIYTANGFEGYREEQERLTKETEQAVRITEQNQTSWKDLVGSSFSCAECGGDLFIGVTTSNMQPYIEGSAYDDAFYINGALDIVDDSTLRYVSEDGEFDIIIQDGNTFVIETNTMRAFAGTYIKYN